MNTLLEYKLQCDGVEVIIQERSEIENYPEGVRLTYAILPQRSAVPKELQGLRFDWNAYRSYNISERNKAARFCQNIQQLVNDGKGLWIHSPESGSGKSLLAAVILGHAEAKLSGIRTMWTNPPEMGEHDKEPPDSTFWERFAVAELVIIDEAEEPFGRYATASPLRLRKRIDTHKAIIYTASERPEQIFRDRPKLLSRIRATSEIITLPAEDVRQQQQERNRRENEK